jgi:hypothetical protein
MCSVVLLRTGLLAILTPHFAKYSSDLLASEQGADE